METKSNFKVVVNGKTYRIGATINIDGTTHYRVFHFDGKLASIKTAEMVRKHLDK